MQNDTVIKKWEYNIFGQSSHQYRQQKISIAKEDLSLRQLLGMIGVAISKQESADLVLDGALLHLLYAPFYNLHSTLRQPTRV